MEILTVAILFIVVFFVVLFVIFWKQAGDEISQEEKAEVAIITEKINPNLEKINSAKATSSKTHNFENINEYHWRNVPIEDRPPASFENWRREKQAKYLNVNVVNVFLVKKDKLWIYNGKPYNTPEEPVKDYFINEHEYTELPNMFFGYIIHAVLRKLPKEYKWINIDGHKFAEQRYETYQEQAINEANRLSIDDLVNDSIITDDYFCNKPIDNPVHHWGLITNKKSLFKWYNAVGIEYIKRYAKNVIKGGSPGGWPDLSFIDTNRKRSFYMRLRRKMTE